MWPFPPFKYWIGYDIRGRVIVERGRFNPASFNKMGGIKELLDGPFDTQEDAARAVAFWKHQDLKARTRQ